MGCAAADKTPTPEGPKTALGEPGETEAVNQALADATQAAAGLGIARHVLYGEAKPDTNTLEALPGRRAFVCAYQKKPRRLCASGTGQDLAASIQAAATNLKTDAGEKIRPENAASIRLKLDVAISSRSRTFTKKNDRPKRRKVATYGFFVTNEAGEASWILPSEMLEAGIHRKPGFSRAKVRKVLLKRNEAIGALEDGFAYEEFETIAWVERDEPGAKPPGVFRLYRLHPAEFADTDPQTLLQSSVWAADYLMSSISAKGKIRYRYKTARDKTTSSYNLIRHAGTTYSLFQAYDRTGFEPYRLAGTAAIGYLLEHTRRDARTGPFLPENSPDFGESLFVVSLPKGKQTEGDVHLGGAGLALVMLDQYVESTGDTETYLEQSRAMARFLVASQKSDGEFLSFPPKRVGEPPCRDEVSPYYPGEAILGLIRLYSYDPNPLWKDTAIRAADWLIDVRDKGKSASKVANDHWLMLGLSYLYLYTGDERYLDHSLHICRAVEFQYLKNKNAWNKYPDYQGGYYDPPRSTPAATRGEGLGAVLETCHLAGRDCGWIEHLLMETVRHEMLSQYDPDMSYWMPNPAKAFGAFNGGLLDTDVRNDFVQHNMSSLLGAERHLLRQKGVVVPGGPGWMEKRLKGTAYPGVPKAELTTLRADSLRYRGETKWEKMAQDQGAK
ncbi:MAG: hypothetical protein CL928_13615 [Deltaproteobacteria bacterium]|nr:hypothetical protein [Deltaproteobacteria bacterium]